MRPSISPKPTPTAWRTFLCAVVAAWAFCLVSCKKETPPEQLASRAAIIYYENLISGDADQFVDGSAQIDLIPDDYRQAQIDNIRMYMEQIRKAHGGLQSVSLDTATTPAGGSEALVTLFFHYADSTTNRVLVPMVLRDGLWLLR